MSKSRVAGQRGQGSQTLLIGAHGRVKGEWRKLTRRAISLAEKAAPFQCEGGEAVELVAQRGVGVSVLGDAENLTGRGCGEPAGAEPP